MGRRALVETRGQVSALERERAELVELLKRSDATPLPTLFVEGESDVTILAAAWTAFHSTKPLPVTILAAGGTRHMESLAGRGAALRQVLADNDREGRRRCTAVAVIQASAVSRRRPARSASTHTHAQTRANS